MVLLRLCFCLQGEIICQSGARRKLQRESNIKYIMYKSTVLRPENFLWANYNWSIRSLLVHPAVRWTNLSFIFRPGLGFPQINGLFSQRTRSSLVMVTLLLQAKIIPIGVKCSKSQLKLFMCSRGWLRREWKLILLQLCTPHVRLYQPRTEIIWNIPLVPGPIILTGHNCWCQSSILNIWLDQENLVSLRGLYWPLGGRWGPSFHWEPPGPSLWTRSVCCSRWEHPWWNPRLEWVKLVLGSID